MSKSKQTQQTQQTQQITPTPDARLQQGVYNLQDMINNLGRADPSQFVAGSSPLQVLWLATSFGGSAQRENNAEPRHAGCSEISGSYFWFRTYRHCHCHNGHWAHGDRQFLPASC